METNPNTVDCLAKIKQALLPEVVLFVRIFACFELAFMRSRKPWRILVSRKTVAFIFELNNSIYGSKSEPCANGANSLCRVMSVLVKSKFGDPTNDKNTVLRLCVTTDNDFFLRLRLLIFIRFSWVGHLASFSKQVTVHFILCISHSSRLYKEELLFSYFSAIRCFAVKLLLDFL